MEIYATKIIESLVILTVFVLIRFLVNKLIDKTITDKIIHKARTQLIRKVFNFILLTICLTLLLIIWGVKHAVVAVFVGSVLTVVGVAMFAQWSLLSNITSGIIMFFNHSVKIGDSICILETKDYEIKGDKKISGERLIPPYYIINHQLYNAMNFKMCINVCSSAVENHV